MRSGAAKATEPAPAQTAEGPRGGAAVVTAQKSRGAAKAMAKNALRPRRRPRDRGAGWQRRLPRNGGAGRQQQRSLRQRPRRRAKMGRHVTASTNFRCANCTAAAAAATLSSGTLHSLNKKVGGETECPMHTLFSFIENESTETIEFVHSYHNQILTQW